jgi:raffinose/stachyose/melibiose transport system substrate-binding protein
MTKKISAMLVLLLILATFYVGAAGNGESAEDGKVQITFTSWRTEDIERMNRINAVFMEQNPDIEVLFQPINDNEYDVQMRAGLETGTGADIIFIESYDSGINVYEGGSISELNQDMPNLKDFPAAAVTAWSTADGTIFAVPSVGVTHGVYYHKDIFDKYGLQEPETWDEFIAVAQTLKDNGEVVFAQGALDDWTAYEVVFSGLGANFYGGEASRQALMAGDMKLTDQPFLDAFKAVDQLQQFLPKGYEALDYVSMQTMFGTGQAAMFMGGSWELGILEDLGTTDLGWFAPPVKNKGDKLQYCFHVDAGIAMNKNSEHPEEALRYLKWVSTPEYAQLIMNELPGFFSYTPGDYPLENAIAKEMIDTAGDSVLTVRTVWEKMSAQSPSGNSLMGEALPKMWKDEFTPEEAAAYVQDGLATWYKPFM